MSFKKVVRNYDRKVRPLSLLANYNRCSSPMTVVRIRARIFFRMAFANCRNHLAQFAGLLVIVHHPGSLGVFRLQLKQFVVAFPSHPSRFINLGTALIPNVQRVLTLFL